MPATERHLYVHQADTLEDVRRYVEDYEPGVEILFAERLQPGKWHIVLPGIGEGA